MFVPFFLIPVLILFVFGKIFERCELMNELVEVHKLSEEAAAKLVCIAEVAEFDTSKRVVEHTEEDTFGFRNYMCKYGIFCFSSEFWCSERSVGGLCNINCKKFLDDDIRDDLSCVMQIQKNMAEYNSWGYDWPGALKRECDWGQNLQMCAETKNDWRSTEECLLKYPELPKSTWKDDGQNGVRALKHEFPHAVALGWTQSDTNNIIWACGGSLITEDTIMTAAHCTFNHERQAPDVVRIGDLNLLTDDEENEMQQFEVDSIIQHPDYTPRYNDIALIKIKTRVNVTQYVIPACLWSTHDIPSKMNLEACGFGQIEYGGPISSILNKVTLTYLDTRSCQEWYHGIRLLKDGLQDDIHLCANDLTGQNMDTCEGDSGGPLEIKLHLVDKIVPFIVGVTAFGKLCGSTESPGVYTRVSSYIDWIREHTQNLPVTPLECAVQYRDKRVKGVGSNPTRLSERDDYGYISRNIFGDKPFATQVTGVIISNRYVLTSAQRLSELSNANRVHIGKPYFIEKIAYHPGFSKQRPEKDDVALVRLRQRIRYVQRVPFLGIGDSFYPSFVKFDIKHFLINFHRWSSWTKTQFPLCITSNTFEDAIPIVEETYYDQSRSLRLYQGSESNLTVCQQSYSEVFDFNSIDMSKILCFISPAQKYVPSTCDIAVGTPIYTKVEFNGRSMMILKGLALYSKDCGPVIATNLSAYTDWINQEAFNKV